MKVKRRDINRIKSQLRKAEEAKNKLLEAMNNVTRIMNKDLGIEGKCDLLPCGDGYCFTTSKDAQYDIYMSFSELIKAMEQGKDITSEFITKNSYL